MDHVAILRKAKISKGDNLLRDILIGTKTIESRWYVHKIKPWDAISFGENIYLKESGCPITAVCEVSDVLQFENLDETLITEIIKTYGKKIAPETSELDFLKWGNSILGKKKFCILIFLKNVKKVIPFDIDKKGFGVSAAWITVTDINKIKLG